jgi:hypothetical protein
MTGDPAPDADVQEQRERDPRTPPRHVPRPDEPEADVLEQEAPVEGMDEDEEGHAHVGESSDWRERYPE